MSGMLAFHIIAIVCWFAGLLYTGRLLIYAREAQDMPSEQRSLLQQQYVVMKKRLWFGITTPAMMATVLVGVGLMVHTKAYHQPWFILKVLLLIMLFAYHFFFQIQIKEQA